MTTPAWVLFDELADRYDQVVPFFAAMAQQTLDTLAPPAGARLLDVGAGRGALAAAAAARGCQVTAVDAAPAMVRFLSRDHPAVAAHVMDAHQLAFADAVFDAATAGFMIHVVEDAGQVVGELRRVLRPGATVALTVPGPAGDGGRWDAFHGIAANYETRVVHGGRPGRHIDVAAILAGAGYVDLRRAAIEVHLPVADPQTCWRHLTSHGFAGLIGSLAPADAVEMQQRCMSELEQMHRHGGIVLSRGAVVHLARTPTASTQDRHESAGEPGCDHSAAPTARRGCGVSADYTARSRPSCADTVPGSEGTAGTKNPVRQRLRPDARGGLANVTRGVVPARIGGIESSELIARRT